MQTTIVDAIAARNIGMTDVAKSAGRQFGELASTYIVQHIREHGPTSGEDLTEACHRAGIIPHDDRAFGPVFFRLSKQGLIRKCGTAIRKRGHMTTGGNVWCAATDEVSA